MYQTEYETTMVLRPDLGGDAVETTLDRVRDVVKNNGGKLLAINHWGKKKLAYEINKTSRGIYVHTSYLGGKDMVAELERNLRISENVMRYLTVQLAKLVNPADRQVKEYVRPAYDSQEMVSKDEGFEVRDDEEYEAPIGEDDVDADADI